MSEYDLKKSEKIGQLYPVLLDAKGNVIDGLHRLEADPNWRTEELSKINTEEKLLIARCVANWHRRQISREEKEKWINDLAQLYEKQGYRVSGRREGSSGAPPNEIVDKIHNETGISKYTIRDYLSKEFIRMEYKGGSEPRVPASQRIETELGSEYVKRHREEIRKELVEEVKEEALEIAKVELSQDRDFIIETIEKAPEILPNLPIKTIERAKRVIKPDKEMGVKEGTIYIVGEYECPQCKKHYLIKCNGKKDWVE